MKLKMQFMTTCFELSSVDKRNDWHDQLFKSNSWSCSIFVQGATLPGMSFDNKENMLSCWRIQTWNKAKQVCVLVIEIGSIHLKMAIVHLPFHLISQCEKQWEPWHWYFATCSQITPSHSLFFSLTGNLWKPPVHHRWSQSDRHLSGRIG